MYLMNTRGMAEAATAGAHEDKILGEDLRGSLFGFGKWPSRIAGVYPSVRKYSQAVDGCSFRIVREMEYKAA